MRKTIDVEISTEGRDRGKIFVITEMSAARAEDWALRAVMALAKSGIQLPDNATQMSFATLAFLGVKALSSLSYVDAQPLFKEMMDCVRIRTPGNRDITRQLIEDGDGADIEEVATRFHLRSEIFKLHAFFLKQENEQGSEKSMNSKSPGSRLTRTSRRRSA